MEFAFIKGKNPSLSRYEIESYLSSRSVYFETVDDTKYFTIARFQEKPDLEGMMKSLGGTLKIAEILANGELPILKEAIEGLDVRNIFKTDDKKFLFGVSAYTERNSFDYYNTIGKSVKKKLKDSGFNANFMGFSRKRPQLSNVEVIKGGLDKTAEIIFCQTRNRFYLGITRFLHNPFEFQKRDIGRPAQRTIFSIPPRISNILVNLAWAKRGDTLLDPFCGIGTILQEAVLNGVSIRGIDSDAECIKSSIENLEWLSKEYKIEIPNLEKIITQGDARKLSEILGEETIDAIATEPFLGDPIRNRPSEDEARKMLEEISILYNSVLSEMFKVLKHGKRIAMVSPRIRFTKTKDVGLDFKQIAERAGFKVINSFVDAESRHRTLREIFVLEKA